MRPIYQNNTEQFSSDLANELEDLRRFSLNSLMTLLAVLTVSGSKIMLPVVLGLLIYTINLRLFVDTCLPRNYPALSRFLHAVPLLGTFCVAGAEIVLDMKSPALAVVVLLFSVLPLITIAVQHGIRCEEAPLPIRIMWDSPLTVSGSPNMIVSS